MAKYKWRDSDEERVYCYLCEGIITKFSGPEAERKFSETGLCEKCQNQIKKAIVKEEI